MAYKFSHYTTIPHWDSIKTSILERDEYTCQICGRKKDDITCIPQVIFSRYAKKQGKEYVIFQPLVSIKWLKFHVTNKLDSRIQIIEKNLDYEKMLEFPYFYHKLSEERHINGEVLKILLRKFKTLNPISPSHRKSFKIAEIRVKTYPHHIDKNLKNNDFVNLITLCDECHIAQYTS